MKKMLMLFIALVSISSARPLFAAQDSDKQKAELAVGYAYLHTNAPPGGCGCFSMNGADAELGYSFTKHWTGVLDFGWDYNGNVNSSSADLRLMNTLAGVRYGVIAKSRWRPFAEIEAGNSNAHGGLSPAKLGIGHANVFAVAAGGGLDLPLSKHFAWRVSDVDYLATLFNNAGNNHQNNLRVSTGIVMRLGK
jgi:peptidoglycan-associated lipoprotein